MQNCESYLLDEAETFKEVDMEKEGLQKKCSDCKDTKDWVRCIILHADGTPILTFFPSEQTLFHLTNLAELRLYKLGTSYIVPI